MRQVLEEMTNKLQLCTALDKMEINIAEQIKECYLLFNNKIVDILKNEVAKIKNQITFQNEVQENDKAVHKISGIEPLFIEENRNAPDVVKCSNVQKCTPNLQQNSADSPGPVKQKSNSDKALELRRKYYQCEKCDFWSYVKYHFNTHLQRTHLNQTILYTNELKKSPSRGFARYITPDNDKKYRCKTCNYSTPFEYDLNSHVRRKHQSSFECDQSSSNVKQASVQKPIVHRMRRNKCPLCNYSTFGNLERHYNLQHSDPIQ